jgi:hypothetical protein
LRHGRSTSLPSVALTSYICKASFAIRAPNGSIFMADALLAVSSP